ncbi:membrane protein FxsA [Lottiidibacillus patelloidae]|uniref:Membrane protein FxsA n=1 Tax=Lottiidibacillus patelloidae TaxID=2670334 RepID=A0A263BW61_9BACI|nr:FxsA family protein [Lottiidibacillus patelloidae]OZM57954.1 membrane protein FxsA [Lottiidibacillus patelloidae]
MMRWLVLLFIFVPALEIFLLIWSGQTIGAFNTFLLIIFTGFVGAWLAKREGAEVLRLTQMQLQRGEIPSHSLLDGICIFAGGLVLLTPGFITDALGFLLLFPYSRGVIKLWLSKWFKKRIQNGNGNFIYWKM